MSMSTWIALTFLLASRAFPQCPGDLTGNGTIDGLDLAGVISAWGTSGGELESDVTGDGIVNGADLAVILGGWGACAPVLTAVSPSVGIAGGGTDITITGRNFSAPALVMVDGIPANTVRVVSPTEITAETPAGSVGSKTVSVSTPLGVTSLPNAFAYVATAVPQWATVIELLPDPLVVFDAKLRAAISESGLAWRVKDTATQIEMVLIPPGTFEMGCSSSYNYFCFDDERPRHEVVLTSPFYMGRFEVTQDEWIAATGQNPSYFTQASNQVSFDLVPKRPVETVSWNDVSKYLSPRGFRLPTEAEWEFAYRASTATAFHGFAGSEAGTDFDPLTDFIAWLKQDSCSAGAQCQTRPVGQKLANGFGLYDMSGNVREWVSDRYGYYDPAPQVDPAGSPSGPTRVSRGGSWTEFSRYGRSSHRLALIPTAAVNYIGFRVARDP